MSTRKPKSKRNMRRRRPAIRSSTTIPRSPQLMPRHFITHLKYTDIVHTSLNNPGQSFVALRYRANSLYDPDPLLGGPSYTGFNEFAAFYEYYRVLSVQFTVEFTNLESNTALTAVIIALNLDPGTTPGSVLESWFNNPLCRHHVVSIRGGQDRGRLSRVYSGKFVTGAAGYMLDDTYRAPVNNNPTNVWYVAFGVFSNDTVMSSGMSYTLTMNTKVRFEELKDLVNPSAAARAARLSTAVSSGQSNPPAVHDNGPRPGCLVPRRLGAAKANSPIHYLDE